MYHSVAALKTTIKNLKVEEDLGQMSKDMTEYIWYKCEIVGVQIFYSQAADKKASISKHLDMMTKSKI